VSKAVAYYDDIYLVGIHEEKTSEHRVTERDSVGRPGTVSFSGNYPDAANTETYGVLVINEDLWNKWFGKRQKLPNMATAEVAAETLVRDHPNIFYGCPVCTFRCKDRGEYEKHVHTHINRVISQFRIDVEED
jgi:hypothetical protein